MKYTPLPQVVAARAIDNILTGMLTMGDQVPVAAQARFAQAVLLLNQLAEITEYPDSAMTDQLKYCRTVILGKTQ